MITDPWPDDDWCRDAPAALAAAVDDLTGPARELLDEAVDHVCALLRTRPATDIAALAVPVAVYGALSTSAVPAGLLAAATATYVAFDVLDDVMDGDRPACWRARTAGELVIGTHILLVTAAQVIARDLAPPAAGRVRAAHRAMLVEVADGQLRAQEPLTVTTTPAGVAGVIAAKSGAMLGRFAEIAAIAAGAADDVVTAAGRFGRELGIARQHVNDLTELTSDRSSDLRNGTATMVVACALQRAGRSERQQLLDDLRAAADDTVRRRDLVHELAPVIAEVGLLVALHLDAARAAASCVTGPGIGHPRLTALVHHTAHTLRRAHER